MPPPDLDRLVEQAARDGRLLGILRHPATSATTDEHLPWDELRHRPPPEGLSVQDWWLGLRMARRTNQRLLPSLLDGELRPFRFTLPDRLLRDIDAINRGASGQIAISEQVTNPATRDRYVVSSLIEEAVRSSQMEGAATTRQVAKEMIRSGRPPRNRSERMIVNNFVAMQAIAERRNEALTPELVLELHRKVTAGTLRDPSSAGTLQRSDDERIAVYSDSGELLHHPPSAEQLPERLERLCAFANGGIDDGYIPQVLRAIAIHFMMGHDHYFADGNGRTARAVFYWSMLNQGFWLTEFLTISRILKGAPVPYARAFLHTEQDEGDLTYFFLHQTGTILRAMADLDRYLQRKADELKAVQYAVQASPGEFNHRELALLDHAVRTPGAAYTVVTHQRSHGVSHQTARSDLMHLEAKGLLACHRQGRSYVWTPHADLPGRLVRR